MMQTFKINFQRHTLVRAAVYIVLGSAIALKPTAFFHLVGYVIASYLVLMGLINIYDDYRLKQQTGAHGLGLASGLLFIILAVVFLLLAPVIVSILPFLLGVVIAVNGFSQLVMALNSQRISWILYSALVLLAGIVLIVNPFKSFLLLFQVFGFILIVMGISEVIGYFRFKKER